MFVNLKHINSNASKPLITIYYQSNRYTINVNGLSNVNKIVITIAWLAKYPNKRCVQGYIIWLVK